MQDHEVSTNNTFIVPQCADQNNLQKLKLRKCCEVLIDFRTCLVPAPNHCTDIKVETSVEVKIDKVCGCKVLIGGILHKTIKYMSSDWYYEAHKNVVHKDIPFSCYINFDCASDNDTFKIAGHEITCDFSELKKVKDGSSIKTMLIEKDIIQIAVESC